MSLQAYCFPSWPTAWQGLTWSHWIPHMDAPKKWKALSAKNLHACSASERLFFWGASIGTSSCKQETMKTIEKMQWNHLSPWWRCKMYDVDDDDIDVDVDNCLTIMIKSTILHNTLSKRNITKQKKTRCKPHTVKPSSGVLHSQLRPSLDQPETTDIANTTQQFLDVSGSFLEVFGGHQSEMFSNGLEDIGGLWEGMTRISQNMQTPYTLSHLGIAWAAARLCIGARGLHTTCHPTSSHMPAQWRVAGRTW